VPLTPDRETRGALSQLVEVLLNKGVYLDLDLVVTVAEVPLIAVNLRATIAGVETMIRYGLYEPSPAGAAHDVGPPAAKEDEAVVRDTAWYREPRSGGPVWREGTLVVERTGDLRWQGKADRRPSLRLAAEEVQGVTTSTDADGRRVLELRTASGAVQLAGADAEQWAATLRREAQDGGREEVEP
jgi:hypothetical protein